MDFIQGVYIRGFLCMEPILIPDQVSINAFILLKWFSRNLETNDLAGEHKCLCLHIVVKVNLKQLVIFRKGGVYL